MAERVRKAFSVRRLPGFTAVTMICFAALYAPIIVIVLYSFNAGDSVALWEGFSLDWYAVAAQNEQVQEATLRSLVIALWASGIATTLATMAALGTTRTAKFPGSTLIYVLINQPLMVPEIVTAVATLIFFNSIGFERGTMTILLAHIAFCIPFAYLPISARMQGIEDTYEQAAMDLYATKRQAFTKILLPLLMPGIISGYLLAFIISLDDFIITNFVKGAGVETLPTAIFGAVKQGIKPNIMAISTMLLAFSIVMVTISYFVSKSGEDK